MIPQINKYSDGELEALAKKGHPFNSIMPLAHWRSAQIQQLDHHFCQLGY
jgi:hypothetical protein